MKKRNKHLLFSWILNRKGLAGQVPVHYSTEEGGELNGAIFFPAETIQHQYDAFAKKTLAGEAKNYLMELAKQSSREVCFSELKENELNKFSTLDEYSSDYCSYTVAGYDVYVKDDLLNEALNNLPAKKREIILLSYFLDMSDEEIGAMMNVVRSTIFRHRKNALARMKKYGG